MKPQLDSTKRAIARYEQVVSRYGSESAHAARAKEGLQKFANKAKEQINVPVSVSGLTGDDRRKMLNDIEVIEVFLQNA